MPVYVNDINDTIYTFKILHINNFCHILTKTTLQDNVYNKVLK